MWVCLYVYLCVCMWIYECVYQAIPSLPAVHLSLQECSLGMSETAGQWEGVCVCVSVCMRGSWRMGRRKRRGRGRSGGCSLSRHITSFPVKESHQHKIIQSLRQKGETLWRWGKLACVFVCWQSIKMVHLPELTINNVMKQAEKHRWSKQWFYAVSSSGVLCNTDC